MKRCSIGLALAGVTYRGLAPHTGVHAASAYAADAFKGTYGFSEQGCFGTSTPLVGMGILNADGFGTVSGTETLQIYGSVPLTLAFQGSYAVNPDGTGTLTLNYVPPDADPTGESQPVAAPTSAQYNFVVVNNKLELRGIRADSGLLATASFTRQ